MGKIEVWKLRAVILIYNYCGGIYISDMPTSFGIYSVVKNMWDSPVASTPTLDS